MGQAMKGHQRQAVAIAAIERKPRNGWTPLMIAAAAGAVGQVERQLSEHPDAINKESRRDKSTALMAAAWRGRPAVVELLIAKGAEINRANSEGQTALMNAAAKGDTAIVELLIAKGAEINRADSRGGTALMAAAIQGDTAVVELLIAKGAEINRADSEGQTALMWAAWSSPAVVELLIAKGAEINRADSRGQTALMWATWMGDTAVVELLIAKGAEINRADSKGRTALMTATELGDTAIVELLIANPAELDRTKAHEATENTNDYANFPPALHFDDLTAVRRSATYEVLVRQSDLLNALLSDDERLRRAAHLLKTYERLRKVNPDFRDTSDELRLARRIQKIAYRKRRKAKLNGQARSDRATVLDDILS